MEEIEYSYQVAVDGCDLNEHDLLKPYGYQRLFGLVAEDHSKKMGFGFDVTTKYNLGWVLVSIAVEIERPVKGSIKLSARTWHSGRRGPFFRRECVFEDESGVLFKGCTHSVLLDLSERKIFTGQDVPFLTLSPEKTLLIEAVPVYKAGADFKEVENRRIYNSHIDFLGHVNNLRYAEFAYDALDEGEKERYPQLKRMEVFFRSEMKLGDEFTVHKAAEESEVIVKGTARGADSFYAVFKYR